MPAPLLQLDPDPSVWLMGPTDAVPPEEWVPAAAEVMTRVFGFTGEGDATRRDIVREVLASTARVHPSPLSAYALRWLAPGEVPLPLFFGMVPREGSAEVAEAWLLGSGGVLIEKPIIDELPAAEGVTIRRSLPYTLARGRQVVVGARYVVDTGHPEALVLAHTAADEPALLLQAQDHIAALLATFRIDDDPAETGR